MKRCFVISPIGQEGTPEHKHAKDVLDLIIKPAADACGFEAQRADEVVESGRITDQMFRDIVRADLCIAVLTGLNPNVIYELAVAHTVGKPVIALAVKGQPLPFDFKDWRYLPYDFDPAAVRADTYTKQLIAFIKDIDTKGYQTEPLLVRWGKGIASALPPSYGFDALAGEIDKTLANLVADGQAVLRDIRACGDGERLFDGLYSSILYASRAAVTGQVDALFYGNLIELDVAKAQLRVRYFAGPYNEEVITRSFPIGPRGQGVATVALNTQKVRVVNAMGQELKVRGEARLSAMVSVPVPGVQRERPSRQAVVLNIDSGQPDVFPEGEALRTHPAGARLERLAGLLAKTNALYRWAVEDAPLEAAPEIVPGALL